MPKIIAKPSDYFGSKSKEQLQIESLKMMVENLRIQKDKLEIEIANLKKDEPRVIKHVHMAMKHNVIEDVKDAIESGVINEN